MLSDRLSRICIKFSVLKHHQYNEDICALRPDPVLSKGWFLLPAAQKIVLGKNTLISFFCLSSSREFFPFQWHRIGCNKPAKHICWRAKCSPSYIFLCKGHLGECVCTQNVSRKVVIVHPLSSADEWQCRDHDFCLEWRGRQAEKTGDL